MGRFTVEHKHTHLKDVQVQPKAMTYAFCAEECTT